MTALDLLSVKWKRNMQIPFSSTRELSICLLTARAGYKDLKAKFEMDPTAESNNLELNNPLNQSESNPWNQKFKDMELQSTINQDVVRTFPHIPLFRDSKIQELLGQILFLWCKLNPDVGYRQGMHELVAVLYYVVQRDAKFEGDPLFDIVTDARFVEYDTGILFLSLMRSVKDWYEVDRTDYVNVEKIAPVVATCRRIQNEILQVLDRELYMHFDFLGIEPQIYGLRWLRLLFSREFTIEEVIILWDKIFEYNSNLCLVEWVCVAMLEAIKKPLIEADYSGTLTLLMHYPCLNDIGMSPVELAESAKRLKALYEAKTFIISTTPGVMDNLGKKIMHQSSVSQPSVSKSIQLGISKQEINAEQNHFHNEVPDLKKNDSNLDKRLSRLKTRDGKIIQLLSSVIQSLQSIDNETDLQSIKKSVSSQCGIINAVVESLKISTSEWSQSDSFTGTEPQELEIDLQKFIGSDTDLGSGSRIGDPRQYSKQTNREITRSQPSGIKMDHENELYDFKTLAYSLPASLKGKELSDISCGPLGVEND